MGMMNVTLVHSLDCLGFYAHRCLNDIINK